MNVLFGKPPKLLREGDARPAASGALDLAGVELDEAVARMLRFPAVADKVF